MKNIKNIKIHKYLIVILLVILYLINNVKGQDISEITIEIPSFDTSGEKDKVNSKLDFNASDEDTITTTVRDKNGNGSNNKSSPKIQGVRVTVDTGKGRKSAVFPIPLESGSKESVEIVDNKNKKKIGIHTDITFEITDDTDDSNSTNSGQSDKDDTDGDASVPVYRGRGSSVTTHRPRRPYDPKTHHNWPANQPPVNHHHYNSDNNGRHYPNMPVYPRPNNEEIYPDNWSGFRPITSVWTTERSYYEPYRPNSVAGSNSQNYDYSANSPQWKPCYCSSSENRNRRISGYILVDDKLGSSFSSQGRNK